MSAELDGTFPRLRLRGYAITSPRTRDYNCIAWAAGNAQRWWEPDPWGTYFWPTEQRSLTVGAFEKAFRTLGYEPCDTPDLERGYEKVALYAKGSEPQHMARQLPTGEWTSKCGRLEDITHSLTGLEGDAYGEVVLVMKRPRGDSDW